MKRFRSVDNGVDPMIIGAMNSPKNSLVEEIQLFGEMGFDFVEVTIEHPSATPEKIMANKKTIMDAFHSYNFGVLTHYPWYFSVAHPYSRIQDAIVQEFAKAFDAASELGAKKATIHTEFLPSGIQDRPIHVAKTIETVKRLSKEASERGLQLLIENFNQGSFSIKEFKTLFSELDIGMTLDIGHASTSEGEGMNNYLAQFKKRISHVHLHDNDRRSDQHLPLGAGKIDMPKAVSELKSFYDGTITLEIHSSDREYLKIGKDKLEILWYGREHHERNKNYQQPKK
ncbi:TPA: sugar phosphate isomerase/epimerase [Candidatus Micrarchaeota archaeon]|nr:sugar phosphate isomerase/epimerase [Candidatus Micrarchaeota archaeon]HIH30392.1 sugar phosphate isomerase/epimerase [Candidatus Micrarchaeota archaeon]